MSSFLLPLVLDQSKPKKLRLADAMSTIKRARPGLTDKSLATIGRWMSGQLDGTGHVPQGVVNHALDAVSRGPQGIGNMRKENLKALEPPTDTISLAFRRQLNDLGRRLQKKPQPLWVQSAFTYPGQDPDEARILRRGREAVRQDYNGLKLKTKMMEAEVHELQREGSMAKSAKERRAYEEAITHKRQEIAGKYKRLGELGPKIGEFGLTPKQMVVRTKAANAKAAAGVDLTEAERRLVRWDRRNSPGRKFPTSRSVWTRAADLGQQRQFLIESIEANKKDGLPVRDLQRQLSNLESNLTSLPWDDVYSKLLRHLDGTRFSLYEYTGAMTAGKNGDPHQRPANIKIPGHGGDIDATLAARTIATRLGLPKEASAAIMDRNSPLFKVLRDLAKVSYGHDLKNDDFGQMSIKALDESGAFQGVSAWSRAEQIRQMKNNPDLAKLGLGEELFRFGLRGLSPVRIISSAMMPLDERGDDELSPEEKLAIGIGDIAAGGGIKSASDIGVKGLKTIWKSAAKRPMVNKLLFDLGPDAWKNATKVRPWQYGIRSVGESVFDNIPQFIKDSRVTYNTEDVSPLEAVGKTGKRLVDDTFTTKYLRGVDDDGQPMPWAKRVLGLLGQGTPALAAGSYKVRNLVDQRTRDSVFPELKDRKLSKLSVDLAYGVLADVKQAKTPAEKIRHLEEARFASGMVMRGYKNKRSFESEIDALAGALRGRSKHGPVKGLSRVLQKARDPENKLGFAGVKDILRSTIVLPEVDPSKLRSLLDKHVEIIAVEDFKDRITGYPIDEYRDVKLIVKTKNGVRGELQFHTPESWWAKDDTLTHLYYERMQKAEQALNKDNLPPDQRKKLEAEFAKWKALQGQIYLKSDAREKQRLLRQGAVNWLFRRK